MVPDVAVLRGQGRTVVLTLPALRRRQTLKYLHLPVLPLGGLQLVVVVAGGGGGGGGGALDGAVQLTGLGCLGVVTVTVLDHCNKKIF